MEQLNALDIHSKQILACVDLSNRAIHLSQFSNQSRDRDSLSLSLSESIPDSADSVLRGATVVTLVETLRGSARGERLTNLSIILGFHSDPFDAAFHRLSLALETIEAIVSAQPASLVIQTRSPLILLASPLLRSKQTKITVVLPLETPSEKSRRQFTPWLPSIPERIEAGMALLEIGVKVKVPVAPLLPFTQVDLAAPAFRALLQRSFSHLSSLNGCVQSYARSGRDTTELRRLQLRLAQAGYGDYIGKRAPRFRAFEETGQQSSDGQAQASM